MSANTLIGTGQVLLAEPFMSDPYFGRAVILLCEHNEEGSLGYILNKDTGIAINELVSVLPDFESSVFYGGPVQTDTLHYLHNVGDALSNSKMVSPGVYWGGDFDELQFLIESKLILPHNIRFFVGYSGWSEGQLKDELESGSWVTAEMDANYIFRMPPESLWQKVMQKKGPNYGVLSRIPEDIPWN